MKDELLVQIVKLTRIAMTGCRCEIDRCQNEQETKSA